MNDKSFEPAFETNKLTLVNFWSSSNKANFEEQLDLIPIYQNYKAKGFEIISVSITENEEQWKKSALNYGFTWSGHYIDKASLEKSENAVVFDLYTLSQNYLVDKQGKIVTKNIRFEDLEELLKKL